MKYILLALLLTGCSYTYPIGTVGSKKLTKVNLGSVFGPGQTMIAIEDTNTHEVTFLSPIGGNGVLPSAVIAGSLVGSSYYIGRGLGKSGDNNNINATSTGADATSTSDSTSESGAASISNPSITVPDPPLAPPITRTRPPFGRARGFWK